MNKKVLFAILALALAAMACGLPSIPGLSGGPLFQDDFGGFEQTWGTGTDSDSSIEYSNGGLNMQVYETNYFVWSTPNDEDYTNIHIEVTAQNNSSDPNTAFGVICNQGIPSTNYYYFAVTASGQYAIARGAVAKDDFFMTGDNDWANSDLIPQDAASYQIGADCGNGVLTLYVNGQQVASVNDSTYTSGAVGLFTWSDEQTSSANVTFDNFIVTELK
ncbi:MAG: hypothetical protein ACOY0R_01455 [Chloroflexota bacterium]